MPRLDLERQNKLEPLRIESCKASLEALGFEVEQRGKALYFQFEGAQVTFYPYSGWHSGKSITDGRGFNNLLAQISQSKKKADGPVLVHQIIKGAIFKRFGHLVKVCPDSKMKDAVYFSAIHGVFKGVCPLLELDPVELTPEIIEAFGFMYSAHDSEDGFDYKKNDEGLMSWVTPLYNDKSWALNCPMHDPGGSACVNKAHLLQLFYAGFTGEELEFKEV